MNLLEVYPNPATKTINISASKDIGRLDIYSIEGKLVYSCNLLTAAASIDVSSLPPGVYSVVCGHASSKLIITQG